jgi:hypothetical protein
MFSGFPGLSGYGLKLPAVVAAGVATVLAVGGMSTPKAVADEGGGGAVSTPSSSAAAGTMDVTPRTVAPGGVVSLRLPAACQAGKKARASADAFVDRVTLAPAADGHGLQGSAFIKSDAVDGSYAIAVDCDGVTSSAAASVTVTAGAAGAAAGQDQPQAQDHQQTADQQQPGDHQLAPDQGQTANQQQPGDQPQAPDQQQAGGQPQVPDQQQAGGQQLAPDQGQAGDQQQTGDQQQAPDQQQAGDPQQAGGQPQAPDHQLTPDHPQAGGNQLTPDQPQTAGHQQAQDHLTPVKPVPAGGGGTAQLAAGPAAAGTSTGPLLATGGFLALGLAGLAIHRRRGASRG